MRYNEITLYIIIRDVSNLGGIFFAYKSNSTDVIDKYKIFATKKKIIIYFILSVFGFLYYSTGCL